MIFSRSIPPGPGYPQDIPVSSQDTQKPPVPEGRPLEETSPDEGGEENKERESEREKEEEEEEERGGVLDSEMLRQRRLQRFYSVPVTSLERKREEETPAEDN